MTIEQVKVVLNDIGNYSTDMLIPLHEVNSIILLSNENLYPDNENHVYFDSKYELVLIYEGKTVDGTFIPNSRPKHIISIDQIQGFHLVSAFRRKSPYKLGLST